VADLPRNGGCKPKWTPINTVVKRKSIDLKVKQGGITPDCFYSPGGSITPGTYTLTCSP
jgi:hypothetical protein